VGELKLFHCLKTAPPATKPCAMIIWIGIGCNRAVVFTTLDGLVSLCVRRKKEIIFACLKWLELIQLVRMKRLGLRHTFMILWLWYIVYRSYVYLSLQIDGWVALGLTILWSWSSYRCNRSVGLSTQSGLDVCSVWIAVSSFPPRLAPRVLFLNRGPKDH